MVEDGDSGVASEKECGTKKPKGPVVVPPPGPLEVVAVGVVVKFEVVSGAVDEVAAVDIAT